MSRVVVCGSLNMDVVVQSARRPATGETILGATVSFLPGGKGLNQAVAAARLGVPTAMVGAVGNDAFSNSLRAFLADNDIDCTGVREIDGPATGVALIQVAQKDNAITVASGANLHFTKEMVREAPRDDEVWVAQFETPIAATEAILKQARAAGARTILNLAPFVPHADRLMKVVDVAVLNEIELSQATGAKLRAASARARRRRRLREAARQGRARRRGDPGRARRRRGDGRRRDRHPRLQGQGRRYDRRRRLLRGCAGGAAVGRRHARRGGTLCQRRGRLFRRAAGRGALDADGAGSCGAAGEGLNP